MTGLPSICLLGLLYIWLRYFGRFCGWWAGQTCLLFMPLATSSVHTNLLNAMTPECMKVSTLVPPYSTVWYSTISDTTWSSLGPQILFQKIPKGLRDKRNSSIFAHIRKLQLKMLDLYRYGRILIKIFSSVEKIRHDKRSEH